MDRKGFIILLLGIGFVFGVWNPLINKLYPPIELPPQEQTKLANSTNTNGTEAVLSAASTNSLLSLSALVNFLRLHILSSTRRLAAQVYVKCCLGFPFPKFRKPVLIVIVSVLFSFRLSGG